MKEENRFDTIYRYAPVCWSPAEAGATSFHYPHAGSGVRDSSRAGRPVRVALGSTSKSADTVELQAFEVPQAEKSEVLRQLLYAPSEAPSGWPRTWYATGLRRR